MAGGTWVTQNKVRPGAYINVKSNVNVGVSNSISGIMTMALQLDFGPENKVVSIDLDTDFSILGYSLKDEKMLLIREALKNAQTVLLYRVNTGGQAAATEGSFIATARYGGTRGNDIALVSKVNVNNTDNFDVETYLAGSLIDSQTVSKIEELKENQVVTFSGTGDMTAFSINLEGGTDTPATAADYLDYFEKIQVFEFNTMALPVNDETIKVAGASFIKRMRDEEGKKSQLVVSGYTADHEAVINVKNGVVLEDGTIISAEQATVWVAGASAAAGPATSLTYQTYAGAVDVTQRYLNTEIIEALQKGEFVFVEKRGEVVVEQDINSLITFTSEKSKDFSKNRVLRTLDDIANNSKRAFEDNFIGKVNNNADGQELFKANRITYFESLQALGAITNFSADDVAVAAGNAKDSITLDVAIQPVDALEKLYMTLQVQ